MVGGNNNKRDRKPINRPVILAMKGHPGTGKSTLAHSLASSLMLPLIDKDDIRDSTFSIEHSLPASPACVARLLNDLSYEAIWRVTSTQLQHGLGVIIDSPLSRRSHLDRLAKIAASHGARLFIVECRPGNESAWRRRLEERGRKGESTWHKPSTWTDIERLLKEYDGCTDYDIGDVPRIVVDTTEAGVRTEDMVSMVVEFIAGHCCDV